MKFKVILLDVCGNEVMFLDREGDMVDRVLCSAASEVVELVACLLDQHGEDIENGVFDLCIVSIN